MRKSCSIQPQPNFVKSNSFPMPNPSPSLPLIGRLQNLLKMANFESIGKSGDDMCFLSEMIRVSRLARWERWGTPSGNLILEVLLKPSSNN